MTIQSSTPKALAGALVLVLTACDTTTATTGRTSPGTVVAVPPGWKTVTFARMAIAVPRGWVVKHGSACPSGAPDGALLLDVPSDPTSCTAFEVPPSVVGVQQLSTETSTTLIPSGERAVSVNGVPVYLGFGSVTTLDWTVPALDVQITGSGPLASQVMYTLHRA